jgi:hypothetical protein
VSQWTEPEEVQQAPPPPPPPKVVQKQQLSEAPRTIISTHSTAPSVAAPPVPEAVRPQVVIRSEDPSLAPPPRVPPPPPPKRTQSNPGPLEYSTPAAALQAASISALADQRPQSQSLAATSPHSYRLSGVLESGGSSTSMGVSPRARAGSTEEVARRASVRYIIII